MLKEVAAVAGGADHSSLLTEHLQSVLYYNRLQEKGYNYVSPTELLQVE